MDDDASAINPRWWYTMPGDVDGRAMVDRFDFSFHGHFLPDPFVAYRGEPRDGMRRSATAGRIRILGDSNVVISGLCPQLQQLLQSCDRRVQVDNGGVIAANADMMLASFVHRTLPERPDVTVVIGGGIDVLTPLRFDPRPGYPHYHALQEVMFDHFFDPAQRSIWVGRTALDGNRLREDFFARIASLRAQVNHLSPTWEDLIVQTFQDALRGMIAAATGAQLRFVYVLAPLLIFKTEITAAEAATLPPAKTLAYLRRVYLRLSHVLAEERERHSGHPALQIVDLHAHFADETEQMFADIIHWTPAATAAMAETLDRLIRPWI